MNNLKYLIPLISSLILVGCGAATSEADTPSVKTPAAPVIPVLTLSFTPTKNFHFTWVAVPGATSYKIKEAITVGSGYDVIETVIATANSFDYLVPLHRRVNAKYILQSCNAVSCTDSAAVHTSNKLTEMVSSIGYIKASNSGEGDKFGNSISLSDDGNTLVVGASSEDSTSIGINSVPGEDSDIRADVGAVYVFIRDGAVWSQQAYLKANYSGEGDQFGKSVSLSGDGNTLAVGSTHEDRHIEGSANEGAAYVFTLSGTTWTEQTILRANDPSAEDYFGASVSISTDGNTLAVGATHEDGSSADSGAVYIFSRSGTVWADPTYLKASNPDISDSFGRSVSLSGDGTTVAIGAPSEDSGTQDNQADDTQVAAGAVYVFNYNGSNWLQQAYIKASNAGTQDVFGYNISISADGNTLAVGATGEDSSATGINHAARDTGASVSGAAYVFTRTYPQSDAVWAQQAYIKASNTNASDFFGTSVSISADGNTLAVGATEEDSNAKGVGGDQTTAGADQSGAVYTFARSGEDWSQQSYVKASNTDEGDQFGSSVTLSLDGSTLAVGARKAKGVNADQEDDSVADAGAVYLY